jgi:hypothetical protein
MPPGIIENADFQQITSGNRLISAQFAGFQLIETHHLPGAALTRHAHADASVNFVISGGLRETVGNLARRREYLCGPGSVLYKPAADFSWIRPTPTPRRLWPGLGLVSKTSGSSRFFGAAYH